MQPTQHLKSQSVPIRSIMPRLPEVYHRARPTAFDSRTPSPARVSTSRQRGRSTKPCAGLR